MDLSFGIIFGIIAMVSWGIADFLVAKVVRETEVFKTFLWSQIFCLSFFVAILVVFFKLPIISLATVAIVLVAGFLSTISYLALYKGLQVGKVSIISPVSACWAVVAVILSVVFLNESLTALQMLGVSLAILGAILTSFKLRDLMKSKSRNFAVGLEYAIIAMLAWGAYFTVIGVLVVELSWFLPMFLLKAATVFYLLAYSGATVRNISLPKRFLLFIVLIGFLEAIAFLAYGIGVNFEYTAIVAPIGATFPMVTILLAKIFFKETLDLNQKIGIVAILTGLVLLSV